MSSTWQAPGSVAPQPVRADHGDPVRPEGRRAPDQAPVLPPPPLPLRPMTIPDLLDGAFAIVKRRPRQVLTLAAIFVIPIEVVSAVLLRDVLGTSAVPDLGGGTSSAGIDDSGAFTGLDVTVVSLVISAASLALLSGALAHLVARWYDGVAVDAGQAARVVLRRSPALLTAFVLVHLLEVVGLIGVVVGAYVVMALLHVVSPTIVAEEVGPLRAIARSVRLTTTRIGASLTVPGLVGVIGALVGFGFGLIPEVLAAAVPAEWDWVVRGAGQTLGQLVVAPFTAGVAVLYHLDLRIRGEGFDLQRRTRELAGG